MLILSRKKIESVTIGDVTIVVLEVRGDKVRLGVVAPKTSSVHRMEVWEALYGPWPRPTLDAAWLQWQDGAVRRLAMAMVEKGDYEALPILADALEEAGCSDAAILEHCRSCGRDIRSSWVVDLILSMP